MSEKKQKQKGQTRRLKEADFKRDKDGKITAKRCLGECNEILNLKLFSDDQRNKRDGKRQECKECRQKMNAVSYQLKVEYLKSEKEKVGKCENKCSFRHANNWRLLEFAHDHRNEKAVQTNGKTKILIRLSLPKMKIERKKGRFLCCNCHRLETKQENEQLSLGKKYSRQARWIKKKIEQLRTFVNEEKLKRKACVHCGEAVTQENFCIFDFDHIDRFDKIDAIANMVTCRQPILQIATEMKKCQLLCANCHKLKTLTEGDLLPLNSKKRKTPPPTKTEDPVLKKQKMDLQQQVNAEWIEMSF